MASADAERARREALRRRLYEPGASDDDRRRFTELESNPQARSDQPAAALTGCRPRYRTAAVTAAGAALVLVVGFAITTRPPLPGGPSGSVATWSASTGEQVQVDVVATTPDSPQATPRATTIAGVPTALQRFHGRGSSVVDVDTRSAQKVNGTLLVMLTSESRDPMSWFATRATTGRDRADYALVVARGDARSEPGDVPAYGIHLYDGAPPTRLAVRTPAALAWTLTVAFLPRRTLPY